MYSIPSSAMEKHGEYRAATRISPSDQITQSPSKVTDHSYSSASPVSDIFLLHQIDLNSADLFHESDSSPTHVTLIHCCISTAGTCTDRPLVVLKHLPYCPGWEKCLLSTLSQNIFGNGCPFLKFFNTPPPPPPKCLCTCLGWSHPLIYGPPPLKPRVRCFCPRHLGIRPSPCCCLFATGEQ